MFVCKELALSRVCPRRFSGSVQISDPELVPPYGFSPARVREVKSRMRWRIVAFLTTVAVLLLASGAFHKWD